jgi:hypothetical protein
LQPVVSDKSFSSDTLKIEYGTRKPRSTSKREEVEGQGKLEAHGIIGASQDDRRTLTGN